MRSVMQHEQVSRHCLVWLTASLAFLALPHLLRLPLWVIPFALVCVYWRMGVRLENLPGFFVKLLLVIFVLVVTIAGYGLSDSAVDISVTVLFCGIFLKLLEVRVARDYLFVCALGFLLVATQLIHSQSMVSAGHSIASAWLLLATMLNAQRTPDQQSISANFRYTAGLFAHAIPLLIVTALLFPRIEPLWTMPTPANTAMTGISDEMTPGDIEQLGRSGELVMRIRFDEQPPAPESLYWRGLVLDSFDGQRWYRSNNRPTRSQHAVVAGAPDDGLAGSEAGNSYEVVLDPTGRDWAYALEGSRYDGNRLWQTQDGAFHLSDLVSRRLTYSMLHTDDGVTGTQQMSAGPEPFLQLPSSGNLQSRELATYWRGQSATADEFIDHAFRHFNQEQFYYTLSPAATGGNAIDDFLFTTREGFCGHYAGALVFLLRAAGYPARIVVGYQGGEYNRFDDYMMVYQYNAHAWAEYWQPDVGWQRADPTMAVAPSRILDGAEPWFASQPHFLGDSGLSMIRFRHMNWVNTLRLRLDSVDYAWHRWVLGFDGAAQLRISERLERVTGSGGLVLLYTVIAVLALLLSVVWALTRTRSLRATNSALKHYQQFLRSMRPLGLPIQAEEGPQAYLQRISGQMPHAAARRAAEIVTQSFVRLHYGDSAAPDRQRLEEKLKSDVGAFRRCLSRRPVGF